MTYSQPQVYPGEFNGDLSRRLLAAPTVFPQQGKVYRRLLKGPPQTKVPGEAMVAPLAPQPTGGPRPPMPATIKNFAGLSSQDICAGGQCGSGWPPDPNGDVGPNHYVEAVNTAIGIYNKNGTLLASFTEDNLWSGVGATPCNGNSQGDPVVLYDWLADRWVITWFAFPLDGFGNPMSPFYQCFAASKTSDPVTGGWWLYAVRTDPGTSGTPPVGNLNDYSKFGLWHDCLYMAANLFYMPSGGIYAGVMFASFSRSDMYNGLPLTYSLGRIGKTALPFTLIPSHNTAKGAGAPQPGTPEYFVSESGSAFAYEVRKFVAGANCGAGGTMSSATNVSQASYSYQTLGGQAVPQPNTANRLDNIDDRLMQKVHYRKVGNGESLWVTHNVDPCANLACSAALPTGMQWAQIAVTGGVIGTIPVQEQIYAPDATLYRWMGSLAVDHDGNMALGYSASNGFSPNFPSIAYSGRLFGDPLNTLPQTEAQMYAGTASQVNTCGGAPCDRWGDYSAMSLDPADSCTFWYVNEYYDSTDGYPGSAGNWHTRIGSFKFPSCVSLPAIALASSLNPSNLGDLVMFTATVSGGSSPTGTVKFTSDGASMGCDAVPLASGHAQCSTSALTAGTHSIVATYSGDAGNPSVASTPLSQTVVGPVPTTVTLTSSQNPGRMNKPVTFTATVTGNNPTGTVGFTSNSVTISGCGLVALTGSGNTKAAACTTSFSTGGAYTIVANYSGDGTNPPGSSSPLLEKIKRR